MKANVGTIDRAIRFALGLALLCLLFILDGGIKYIGLIGIVPLATALLRFCPLYVPLGISTNRRRLDKSGRDPLG